MSLVLVHGTRKPVIRIGRIAGQYAKPRSADVETRGDVTLPAYRGDLINRDPFTASDREPDPTLMLRAYERAALTLNFIRALTDGGFADLHHPEYWDVSFAKGTPNASQYERIVESIRESLDFVSAITGIETEALRRVDVYTSHEALALPYEQAQTRVVPRRAGHYNLSTHFPWIGMRTAQLDGAHVEFHRVIRNPLGIKIGPAMTIDWLRGLLDILDPSNEPGRIVLIHRMGADHVESKLPPLVEAVRARPGATCCGCATRCTATPRPRAQASRRAVSTRWWVSSSRASRCTRSSARGSAASTSSSPARMSPSASAARVDSTRPASSARTRVASIRASTTSRRSRCAMRIARHLRGPST